MFVVLFSGAGAVPGAVGQTLWPSSETASPAPNLDPSGWRGVFAALGVRSNDQIRESWQVIGPSSDADVATSLPMVRGPLFEACEQSLGSAPWLLRDWFGYHGWNLLALVTRDGELASRVAAQARASAPQAHAVCFEARQNFDAVFTSICFDAYGREGQDAWDLAEQEGAAPLVLFDESEIAPDLLEDNDTEDDGYGGGFDEEDDDWNNDGERREDLRSCLALPELARDGAVSVRRIEDHALYAKLWSLSDSDFGPAYAAVSGRVDAPTLLERYAEARYFALPPQRARALSGETEDWVYLLGYGGGSDEYLGWLHIPAAELAARVTAGLEADDRLVALA
ncbi:MAG: hypothetical protein AAF430_00030 [Myxococcota bacterium]